MAKKKPDEFRKLTNGKRAQATHPLDTNYSYISEARRESAEEPVDELVAKWQLSRENIPLQLRLAGKLVEAGRVEEARALVQNAFPWKAGDWRLHYFKAEIKFHQKKPREALEAIDRALSLNPSLGALHLQIARYLIEVGVYRRALWYVDRADKEPATLRAALLLKATCLLKLGDEPGASEVLARIVPLGLGSPQECALTSSLLIELGNFPEAVKVLAGTLKTYPLCAESYVQLGEIHLWRNQQETASVAAERLIKLNPRLGAGYRIRGAAKILGGHLVQGVADLNEAIRLDPRDIESYVWRGEAHRRLKKYPAAVRDLDTAADVHNGSVTAYANRALALLEMDPNGGDWRRDAESISRQCTAIATARALRGKSIFESVDGLRCPRRPAARADVAADPDAVPGDPGPHPLRSRRSRLGRVRGSSEAQSRRADGLGLRRGDEAVAGAL